MDKLIDNYRAEFDIAWPNLSFNEIERTNLMAFYQMATGNIRVTYTADTKSTYTWYKLIILIIYLVYAIVRCERF